MRNRSTRLWVAASLWLVWAAGLSHLAPAWAQTGTGSWTVPERIFEGTGTIHEPIAVADPQGNLHVLWAYEDAAAVGRAEPDQFQVIYYSRWDGAEWTVPVDIVAAPFLGAPSAAADAAGNLHLTWYGANNQLYYGQAPTLEAASARAWSTQILADRTNRHSHILAAQDGRLHVVYAALGSGGPSYVSSSDGGSTWSPAVSIAATVDTNSASDYVRLASGSTGQLYVVWTEFQLPNAWPPTGLYFARSDDGGNTWSAPQRIAGSDYNQVNIAVTDHDTVHLAWNGIAGVHGRYHQWSADGGQTWSDIDTLSTPRRSGSDGPPPLVVDSAGILHLLTTDDGCLWQTTWQNQAWNVPVCVSRATWIEEPSLTVLEGNQLHAVFWHGRTTLWHSSQQTSAPHIEPRRTTEPGPISTTRPSQTPDARAPRVTAAAFDRAEQRPLEQNPSGTIVVATFPVLVGVMLLIGGRVIRHARR